MAISLQEGTGIGRDMGRWVSEFDKAVHEIQSYLEFLRNLGCGGVELSQKNMDMIRSWGDERRAPVSDGSNTGSLAAIYEEYATCRRCGLAEKRSASFFGVGPQTAVLMFVGFVPESADEQAGEPYTGEKGALLNRIIGAMGLDRNSVYICHAVKCLPHGGRLPNKWEAKACRHYLLRQVEAIHPRVICTLGESSARLLLGVDARIEQMRGVFHEYKGIPVMPTYDPAFLLDNPAAKRPVWEDIKKVMKALEGT